MDSQQQQTVRTGARYRLEVNYRRWDLRWAVL